MLIIKNLTIKKNSQKILDGLNLKIATNEIHILLGLNGSGKTTLAQAIMGLVDFKTQTGQILFNKKNISKLGITKRAKLGITLSWQEPAKFKGIKVKDYLKINSKNFKEIENVLNLIGFFPKEVLEKEISVLSGGERKKIELASIILTKPKLAVLDEIDSGLDIFSLKKIFKAIRQMRALNQTSFLLITHNEKVADLGDKASLICFGKIIMTGFPKKIKSYYSQRCQRRFEKICVYRKR